MGEGQKILVVDDEPSIVKMVGKRLEAAGYEVVVAMDGQEALEKVQEARPDLILLDLMLPKVDGYEVCKSLKQAPATHAIPIIIVSARTQNSDQLYGYECGADAYLCKPFHSQDLLKQVAEFLGARPELGGPS